MERRLTLGPHSPQKMKQNLNIIDYFSLGFSSYYHIISFSFFSVSANNGKKEVKGEMSYLLWQIFGKLVYDHVIRTFF